MWGLVTLVQRTTLGRSIRAVSEDREMATVMGIDVGRVVGMTFFLGSALGGAAGVLIGLYYTQIDFVMGYSAGLKAFTAAVLGGIGNVVGAALGGIILGVLEQVGPNLFLSGYGVPSPNQLQDVIAFTVLVVVLIFRPWGLLGRKESS